MASISDFARSLWPGRGAESCGFVKLMSEGEQEKRTKEALLYCTRYRTIPGDELVCVSYRRRRPSPSWHSLPMFHLLQYTDIHPISQLQCEALRKLVCLFRNTGMLLLLRSVEHRLARSPTAPIRGKHECTGVAPSYIRHSGSMVSGYLRGPERGKVV